MRHLESKIQSACVTWFGYQYPDLYYNLFAVPNGVATSATQGRILKGEGMKAGVSDLILLVPSGAYHGLCIEFKTTSKSSRQRDTQKAFQSAVERQGYKYIIVRTCEEFISEISKYFKYGNETR